VTRHEFLAALHDLLRPKVYLEIGVQFGTSLQLALPGCKAVGVDPAPLVTQAALAPDTTLVPETSDVAWLRADIRALKGQVDLAFIDGMHLAEFVLRDFCGVEELAAPGAAVVFDDVLPRNNGEAARRQCPGDWTGDVWRIEPILAEHRPDLRLMLVDTQPTGCLVVTHLDPGSRVLRDRYDAIVAEHVHDDPQEVPFEVLERRQAVTAAAALAKLGER
jgi:hypothetical protein